MRTHGTKTAVSDRLTCILSLGTHFSYSTHDATRLKRLRRGDLWLGKGWIRSANGISELNAVCLYYKVYYHTLYTSSIL